MSFAEYHRAAESERQAVKAETLRAEAEADMLARIPDAESRVCCTLRSAAVECEGECQVLASVLG